MDKITKKLSDIIWEAIGIPKTREEVDTYAQNAIKGLLNVINKDTPKWRLCTEDTIIFNYGIVPVQRGNKLLWTHEVKKGDLYLTRKDLLKLGKEDG